MKVTITCPKCHESILIEYRTSIGHAITDEALAIDRAIQKHKCKVT